MKIKTMFKWNWKNNWIALAVMAGVLLALQVVLGVVFTAALGSDFGKGVQSGTSNSTATIMAFVVGCVTFAYSLRFGGSHGVSRRSIYLGDLGFMLSFSFALVLCGMLISFVSSFGAIPDVAIFRYLYTGWAYIETGLPALIAQFFWELSVALACSSAGYFMGGAFYRLGKVGKIVLAAGTPITLFVLVPLVLIVLPSDVQISLALLANRVHDWFTSSPFTGIALLLVASALFCFLGWLTVRRAPVNPAPTL